MSDQGHLKADGSYWRLPLWFPKLKKETIDSLSAFHTELLFFNNKLNLISAKTTKNADLLHIADGVMGSLAFLDAVEEKDVFDLGSGNGVPGIILALMDKTRRVTLVDADTRKTEFLRHCVHKLNLTNCKILNARVEDLPEGMIKCGVTRGFASISKTLLFCRKGAADKCVLVHFKGPSWSSEVAAIPSQILAHWEPVHTCDYTLPTSDITMSIILTRRTI